MEPSLFHYHITYLRESVTPSFHHLTSIPPFPSRCHVSLVVWPPYFFPPLVPSRPPCAYIPRHSRARSERIPPYFPFTLTKLKKVHKDLTGQFSAVAMALFFASPFPSSLLSSLDSFLPFTNATWHHEKLIGHLKRFMHMGQRFDEGWDFF